jgi:hypothetical protein
MELCLIQRPITIFLPPIISGMMLSTVVHRNFDRTSQDVPSCAKQLGFEPQYINSGRTKY